MSDQQAKAKVGPGNLAVKTTCPSPCRALLEAGFIASCIRASAELLPSACTLDLGTKEQGGTTVKVTVSPSQAAAAARAAAAAARAVRRRPVDKSLDKSTDSTRRQTAMATPPSSSLPVMVGSAAELLALVRAQAKALEEQPGKPARGGGASGGGIGGGGGSGIGGARGRPGPRQFLLVVDVFKRWAGPCVVLQPTVEQMLEEEAGESSKATFVALSTEDFVDWFDISVPASTSALSGASKSGARRASARTAVRGGGATAATASASAAEVAAAEALQRLLTAPAKAALESAVGQHGTSCQPFTVFLSVQESATPVAPPAQSTSISVANIVIGANGPLVRKSFAAILAGSNAQ